MEKNDFPIKQILQYLAEAMDNKEIAIELNIKVSTVTNHVSNILDKMGV